MCNRINYPSKNDLLPNFFVKLRTIRTILTANKVIQLKTNMGQKTHLRLLRHTVHHLTSWLHPSFKWFHLFWTSVPTNKRTSHVKGKSLNYETVIYKYISRRHAAGEFDTILKLKSEILSWCCCCIPFSWCNIKWALRKDKIDTAMATDMLQRNTLQEIQEIILIFLQCNKLTIFPLHRYIKHDHNIQFCWIKAQMEFYKTIKL